MQAYQLATGGTAISWDWRGSNNNFVCWRNEVPWCPPRSELTSTIFFSFHLFSGFFHPCSLLPYRPTPFNQLCARHWSPSPFWRRFTVNLPEDQLWTRIHWGNWNFSLQSLDFCIAFAPEGWAGKVQIYWEGHKNSKKTYHFVLTLLSSFNKRWEIFSNFVAFSLSLWPRIHWGNWNFSLQRPKPWFLHCLCPHVRVSKVQIFLDGHKNLKKVLTLI